MDLKSINKTVEIACKNNGIRIAVCCYDEMYKRGTFIDFVNVCNALKIIPYERIIINNSVIYFLKRDSNYMGMDFDYALNSNLMRKDFLSRVHGRQEWIDSLNIQEDG